MDDVPCHRWTSVPVTQGKAWARRNHHQANPPGWRVAPTKARCAAERTPMTHPQHDTLTGDYVLDVTRSRLGFVARHAMVTKVHGQFDQFGGAGHLDLTDWAKSFAEVSIDAASISTGNEQRDAHLRSSDFLNVPEHPHIHFRSTQVTRTDDKRFRMVGDLTVRGVTRSVDLEFTCTGVTTEPLGDVRLAFDGSGTINRRDWGVSWNAAVETGGVLVSEMVTLAIRACARRLVPGTPAT